jgi:ribosomal protein S18 acetylase RimI-like enzyme
VCESSSVEVAYRAVMEGDFDWLLSLRRITMDSHLRASGDEPLEEVHCEAVLTDFEWTRIIIVSGQDIGMVKLVKQSSPWHLRQIQIEPDFQGRGIGKIVLEEILQQAKGASASIVLNVLRVNPAKELYGFLGFEVVDENERAYKMLWCA